MEPLFRSVNKNSGLTLIELVTVIGVLSILFTILLALLNPVAQINYARDAKRQQDLTQIRTALDSYYDDLKAYPTTIPFGGTLASGTTTYMKKVPTDPNYIYMPSAATNPQAAVIFAKESLPNQACSLASSCTPQNFNTNWYCVVLGTVDCSYITRQSLP